MTLLAVALLLAGKPKGDGCEARCADVVKVCAEQCRNNLPKEMHANCKAACDTAGPGCMEQCKARPPEEKEK